MIYLIISFLVFWLYCIYAWSTVGVKTSISDTFFHVKHPFLFRLFNGGIALPLMFYSYNEIRLLLASAALIFTIAFAAGSRDYEKHKVENANHVIGATAGILLAFIAFCIKVDWTVFYKDMFFWASASFLVSALIILPLGNLKKPVKNHTTWIEVAAFSIIILTLFVYEAI
jgi:hypothetical protein